MAAGVKGNALFVGMALAHRTPSTGLVEMLRPDLCALVGKSREPVRAALKELAELGFLAIRRRGSVPDVFTWKESAYKDPRISLLAHNAPCAPEGEVDAHQRTARDAAWKHWLVERELKHKIPATVGWGQQRRLSEQEWCALAQRILLLAQKSQRAVEPIEVAIERAAGVALRYWVRERRGNRDFLVTERHPLWRLLQDLDDVTAVAAERLRQPVAEVASEPGPSRVEPRAARDVSHCDDCGYATTLGHANSCAKSRSKVAA